MPTGVYLSRGKYYKVIKNVWYPVGKTLDDVKRNLPLVKGKMPLGRSEILNYCQKVFIQAKQNAKGRRKLEFSIQKEDLLALLDDCKWKCAVTGIKFNLEVIAGKKPFAPSLDRINSDLGYVPGNCRFVCVAANYAMNVWGEMVLNKMLKAKYRMHVELAGNA